MENVDMFNNATAQLTFHDFLDRMRHPSAADLVRSIKNFIGAFLSNPPDPERDSQSVQDFLTNTENVFKAHPLWAGATEEDFESSGEGLEKYLMTKLFARAFSPLSEDAEQDQQLSEKMYVLQQFIRPEHLDIRENFQNETSWLLAQKELQKINTYKAPRDKLVCILNCCRVINNLLLNVSMATNDNPPGADDFLPVLIYVVIKANPPQLHSNLLYIQRYRHQNRLVSEANYFYTNIVSAESFIANLNSGSLTMDPLEFEKKMEAGRAAMGAMNMVTSTPAVNEKTSDMDKALVVEKTGKSQSKDTNRGVSTTDNSRPSPNKGEKNIDTRGSSGTSVESLNREGTTEKGGSVEKLEAGASGQVLEADKTGQLAKDYPFLYASAGDLRVVDVESLLQEYKELVLRYVALRKSVEGFVSVEKPVISSHADSRQELGEDTEGTEIANEPVAHARTMPEDAAEFHSTETPNLHSEPGPVPELEKLVSRDLDTAGSLGEENEALQDGALTADEFVEESTETDSRMERDPQEKIISHKNDETQHAASQDSGAHSDPCLDKNDDTQEATLQEPGAYADTHQTTERILPSNARTNKSGSPKHIETLHGLVESESAFPEFEMLGTDELEKNLKESHTPELLEYSPEESLSEKDVPS